MSKTFTHAGVSRFKGAFKPRFANDAMRVKVLAKNGSSDIDLIELINPMTKEEAIAYLLQINFDNGNAEIRECLEAALTKREPKAPKEPKAKREKKAKPTLEDIRNRAEEPTAIEVDRAETAADDAAAESEDAPY